MQTSLALAGLGQSVTSASNMKLMAGAAETIITPDVVLKSLADVNWIGEVGDGHYTPKEGELIPVYGDLYARSLMFDGLKPGYLKQDSNCYRARPKSSHSFLVRRRWRHSLLAHC